MSNVELKTEIIPDGNEQVNALRMTVIQITYAVLISILAVANILLVWSLAYIIVFYEKRGRLILKQFNTIIRLHQHNNTIK